MLFVMFGKLPGRNKQGTSGECKQVQVEENTLATRALS